MCWRKEKEEILGSGQSQKSVFSWPLKTTDIQENRGGIHIKDRRQEKKPWTVCYSRSIDLVGDIIDVPFRKYQKGVPIPPWVAIVWTHNRVSVCPDSTGRVCPWRRLRTSIRKKSLPTTRVAYLWLQNDWLPEWLSWPPSLLDCWWPAWLPRWDTTRLF